MEKFVKHCGVAVPLRRSNVDTDQIIPAVFLKKTTRTGFAEGLFSAWRDDPEFVLNRPEYAAGSVLVAGPDFGTGSSREHAVWALREYGFRVVISSKFADIFRGNSDKDGLVTAVIPQEAVERLWELIEANPGIELCVDLEDCVVLADGTTIPFQIDPYSRYRLLNGLDDVSLTLQHEDLIRAFEDSRPTWKPRTLLG